MSLKIGKVSIIEDDYPGRDLYSDGAVEDELLDIAKNAAPEDFDRVVAERRSWPVMYHFSGIRKNILDWYPFRREDRVLEIGSGCGAVTASVASRAGQVTCVDLSKKRSLVNAWRNRERENLEIRLGNFQDVEKRLGCDYTVITLIGVFEYASSYIDAPDPYEAFLRQVARHLAPGGVILIAIENRLGLKYFAGCREDHTGRYFDGIENYPESSYAKTFSRRELRDVILRAGFEEPVFRYPYPDYKFPMAIYSDGRLPLAGELRNNLVNYDRTRLVLFDEAKAFDSLAGNGQFPDFSNSFFVELRREGEAPAPAREAASFLKFSNDRAPERSILTEVWQGSRVVKRALSPAGAAHVLKMKEDERALSAAFEGTRFRANRCELSDGAAVFEFVPGKTLEELIAAGGESGTGAVPSLLWALFEEIDRMSSETFRMTEAFGEVFGRALPENGQRCAACSDVDLLPSNIIENGGLWHVIDYEWTFGFPIPADYIKWRIIHYFTAQGAAGAGLDPEALLTSAGIRREDLPVFAAMEASFQEWIAGDAVPLWKLYPDVSKGAFRIGEGETGASVPETTVYFDRGQGFSEADSLHFRADGEGCVRVSFDAGGAQRLRIDPAEGPCAAVLEALEADGAALELAVPASNGHSRDGRRFVFLGEDPQILTGELPAGGGQVSLMLRVKCDAASVAAAAEAALSESEARAGYLRAREKSLEQTVSRMKEAVDALKETRAARAWRASRIRLGKSDPFESVRPALVNHREAHLTLDRRSYEPDGIHLLGWFFDPAFEGEGLRVTNASGGEVPAKIARNRREDVSSALGFPADRPAGFHITIAYEDARALPLYLEAENPRGIMRCALDIGTDPGPRIGANTEHRGGSDPGSRAGEGGPQVLVPSVTEYDDWAAARRRSPEELRREAAESTESGPTLSFAIPLYRTPEKYLFALLDSLTGQTYGKIEINLADGSPDGSLGERIRSRYPGEERIRYRHLGKNSGIAGNTNAAIDMATGDYLLLADHDDVLDPSACFEIAAAVMREDPDVIYTDEDKLSYDGRFLFGPHFKPDYNPDYLTDSNYICHLFAVRRTLALEAGPMRSDYDGAQDYDFILRCCERAGKIVHIPMALYHWRAHPESTAGRPESKLYAFESGRRALEAHFKRIGVDAEVSMSGHPGHYRVKLPVSGDPLVSILIPNRDQAALLRRSVESILRRATWRNYEILILENGSEQEETHALYRELSASDGRIRVIDCGGDAPFNFAAINNAGAAEARGEYLLFLNNDTEVVSADFIERMLSLCQRPDTGCAGAYLTYPDGRIQHAGVIIGLTGPAGHIYGGLDMRDFPGGGRAAALQDLSAVTGACMMTGAGLFRELGGFDERFAVAFNDVDYCLKVRETGKRVVYQPAARLIHYESASRGSDEASADPARHRRFEEEGRLLKEKWPGYYRKGDPFYNINLSLERPDGSLA